MLLRPMFVRIAGAMIIAMVIMGEGIRLVAAQPGVADEPSLLEEWAHLADANGVLGFDWTTSTMGFGDWHRVYEPSQQFYDGQAASPYGDDLEPLGGEWAAAVYSNGVTIGAAVVLSGPWRVELFQEKSIGEALDTMAGADRLLEIPLAQAAWLVHADDTVTPADDDADAITPGGGDLADIYAWLPSRYAPTGEEIGGAGGASGGNTPSAEAVAGLQRPLLKWLIVVLSVGGILVAWRRLA